MVDANIRVLIVEDDEEQREGLAEWLQRKGKIVVETVATGEEALTLIHRVDGKYDVVLMDEVLPGIDGIETMRRIKTDFPNIQVIMFTGVAPEAGITALREGAYRYIIKPINNEEIAILLSHVSEIRQLERRLVEERKLMEAIRRIAEHTVSIPKEQLLQEVANAGRDLLEVPVCIVWELDRADGMLKAAAWAGELDEEYRRTVQIDSQSEATKLFLEERRPLAIANVQDAPLYCHREEVKERNWVSLLTAPMIAQDRVIGILDAYTYVRRTFAPWEKQLLATFAAQAAIAIRQASLTKHSQEVSRLALTGDYEKLAGYVVEAVHDLTGLPVILWMMSDREGERGTTLRIAAARGIRYDAEDYIANATTPTTPGSSITSIALGEKRPVQRRDILDETIKPCFHNIEKARQEGWRSFLSVPLLGQGAQPLGALSIYDMEPRDFSESETALLWTFANQSAIAFENVQIMQRLNTQLESLHQVVQKQSLEEVLDQTLKGINTILGEGTSSSINLYDEASDSFGLSRAVGPLADLLRVSPRPEGGTARHVLETEAAYYLDDVTKPPPGYPTIRDAFNKQNVIRSFAALPLKRQERIVGVLFVNLQLPISFSAGVRRVLELFASQAAVAIENAGLFLDLDERATQLLQLQEVTVAISAEPSDLEKVLHVIVKSLSGIFREVPCAIRLYDSRTGAFERRAAIGDSDKQLIHVPRPDGATHYVVETKAPLYAEDTTAKLRNGKPIIRKELAEQGLGAVAYLPLLSGENVVGMLYLNLPTPHQFSQNDKQILELFAGQAAIAVENARLFQELDERSRRLVQLQKVTATISTETSDLEKVLHLIVDRLSEIFWKAPCAIRPYDSTAGTFEDRVSTGELRDQLVFTPRPDGASRHVVNTKIPLYVENPSVTLPDGQLAIRKELMREGVRAIAYLPLLSKGNVIGILYVNLTESYRFSEDDKRILGLFADQAAIAIENARLYEAEQGRRHIAETLLQVSNVLSSTLELNEVLRLILQQLREVIPYDSVSIQRLWGERLEIVACQGFEELAKVMDVVFPLDPKFPNYRVVTTKEPLAVEDAAQDYPHFRDEADRYETGHIRSWLGVPLIVKDRVIGMIALDRMEVCPFTTEESELAKAFASHAATAIENAWLFREVTERATQLERLQEVTATISAETADLEKVLHLIVESLSGIFQGVPCAIRLYDSETGEFGRRVAIGTLKEQLVYVPRPGGATRYVLETKTPLYAEDSSVKLPNGEPVIRKELKGQGLRAVAYLPLLSGENVVGMLYLNLIAPYQFSQNDRQILELFADQAAIAIQNARLFENAQRRIRDLKIVNDVVEVLGTKFGTEDLLNTIVSQIAVQLNCTHCTLFFPQEEKGELLLVPHVTYGVRSEIMTRRFKLDEGLAGWVFQKGESVVLPDVRQDDRFSPAREVRDRPRSMLVAPVKVGDQTIGVISADQDEYGWFSESDRRLLDALARHAGIAIEKARLYDDLDRRVQELEVLTEMSRGAISDLGIDQILDLVYEEMGRVIDLSEAQVQIVFYDEAKDEVSFPLAVEQDGGVIIDVVRWSKREAQYREPGEDEIVEQFKPRVRRDPPGLNEYVIRTKQPLLIPEDFEQKAADLGIKVWPTFGRLDRPTHSWLGVPMMVANRVIGVISIQSLEQERAFDEEQQELLSTVASQAAVAIENARLYQQLNEKVAELERAQNRIAETEAVVTRTSIAADFVHRLNNLAGTIPIWVDQVREHLGIEALSDKTLANYLDRIESDADALLRAAEELKSPPEEQDVHMESLLNALVRQALIQTPAKVEIGLDCKEKLPSVRVVYQEIANALWSIMENGIDAMPEGGALTIKAESTEDADGKEWIQVLISDEGQGITEEDVDKIFSPFYSTKAGHTGYGLWRARNIVERIGGSIEFESDEGLRTTFIVMLPALREAAEDEQ